VRVIPHARVAPTVETTTNTPPSVPASVAAPAPDDDLDDVEKLCCHLKLIYDEAKKWNTVDFDITDLVVLSKNEYEVLKSYRDNIDNHKAQYTKSVIASHQKVNEKTFNTKPIITKKTVKKVVDKPKKSKTLFD
jgi:hypothetical protein